MKRTAPKDFEFLDVTAEVIRDYELGIDSGNEATRLGELP